MMRVGKNPDVTYNDGCKERIEKMQKVVELSVLRLEFYIIVYLVMKLYNTCFLDGARSEKACIVFFEEVDDIGCARFDNGVGGDNKGTSYYMLEIVNQLDGFLWRQTCQTYYHIT
ncbi:unnamed protein product [Cochlearia groenlandica]